VHRNYHYVTVSSQNVCLWYAQGFGLSTDSIIPAGVPRTDVFVDKSYETKTKEKFYQSYPKLKEKKIILFAPTFRGKGKETAFYPMEYFEPVQVCQRIGEEYVILIKLHPFIEEKITIPQAYADQIIDLSEFPEINDLLFVSDLLITDYSSLIFEASLRELPMLFYVFDLEEYTRERNFYFDFAPTVPGKKVFHQEELITAIKEQDFQQEKVLPFRKKYFEHFDGKSTERVVDLILKQLERKSYDEQD
jgi:CDP-glycerol glycerophosphotransferase (TagB/SpsB family)